MRNVGVVTVARSDYGIYLPVLRRIEAESDLRLRLFVGGMHLSPEFGLTVKAIEADGLEITERVEMLLSSDTPEAIAKSMGLGLIGFGQAYTVQRPDILLVLGDRFEMHAAALAALPFKIPVAHIHGGEVTEGAIDDSLRHSITKLSHLHFVSTEEYGRRVKQMGEEPWRIIVSGAPGLDNLRGFKPFDQEELRVRYGIDFFRPTLLVTYHPVTLEYEDTQLQIENLLASLEDVEANIVVTYPNADTQGRLIIDKLEAFCSRHERAYVVKDIGTKGYFSMMMQAAAMVGNSSSGLIEAPSFELPVVNIGSRQQGRIRAGNVIDVGYDKPAIAAGIQKAISEEFRAGLAGLKNPYGEGRAAELIVQRIKEVEINARLIRKHFCDLRLSQETL